MALDRDGTTEKTDRPSPAVEAPPLPPDRPGDEGAPSRVASRAAAQIPDRPASAPGRPDDALPETSAGESPPDPPVQDPEPPVDEPTGEVVDALAVDALAVDALAVDAMAVDAMAADDTAIDDTATDNDAVDDAAGRPVETDGPPEARPAAGTREPVVDRRDDPPRPVEAPVEAQPVASPPPEGGRSGAPDPSRPAERAGPSGAAADRAGFPEMTDRSGYVFSDREYAFANVSPDEAWDMKNRRVPLGMESRQWHECVDQLREALAADGITNAVVRLRGPSTRFHSDGARRWFPQNEDDLRTRVAERHRKASEEERDQRADKAVARYRAAGFSQDRAKPLTPFFDSLYRLGIAEEPDGYDFRIDGDIIEAPALRDWAARWEDAVGRGVTLTGSEHDGPAPRDDDDWIVVDPAETDEEAS
ncbi:hypothetical protein ACQPZP_31070 [Spirillospora sp. CA-142024]|uniref:hypothetical protein n=1 Tax=Spirillospora sp. CA-142024 TaxID=3240036 RepID=UPI003D9270A8